MKRLQLVLNSVSWKTISDNMNKMLQSSSEPGPFTPGNCKNKFSNLRNIYAAFCSIKEASGLGDMTDAVVWEELIAKNPLCKRFQVIQNLS